MPDSDDRNPPETHPTTAVMPDSDDPNPPETHTDILTGMSGLLLLIVAIYFLFGLFIPFLSYIRNCISLVLPPLPTIPTIPLPPFPTITLPNFDYTNPQDMHFLAFLALLSTAVLRIYLEHFRSRKCGKVGCRGLKRAIPEFIVEVQDEDVLTMGDRNIEVKFVNDLPKRSIEDIPEEDYQSYMEELKNRAPEKGRAVMLFRGTCGCPLSKLQLWGPQASRLIKRKNKGHTAAN